MQGKCADCYGGYEERQGTPASNQGVLTKNIEWRQQSPASLRALPERLFDFLVGLVLAQSIHRPDRRWDPANHRKLKNQARHARNRLADCKKRQPRQKKRNE